MKSILSIALIFTSYLSFSQVNGTSIFDESYVHTINLDFADNTFWFQMQADYDEMVGDMFNAGTGIKKYVPAACTIDSIYVDTVGVRWKGNYSNWGGSGNKKPLKIDFNEFVVNNSYDGIKKLNLQNCFKDPSMMRDVMSYRMMRHMGIPAPRTSYARVYLNGTYWGVYVLTEQVNKGFLKNHFDNNDGNLFKCIDNTDLLWQGSIATAYEDEFELKTNEIANNWTDFVRFVDIVNNTPTANFKDSLDSILNTHAYLHVLAMDVLLLNWDSYYDHGRNFYMYQDPTTGKFNWIPWDYNLAFSEDEIDIFIENLEAQWGEPAPYKPLNQSIVASSELKEILATRYCHNMNVTFNVAAHEDFITTTAALIRNDLMADPNSFYTISDFDQSHNNDISITTQDIWGPTTEVFRGIKPFISERVVQVNQELAAAGYDCEAVIANLNKKESDRKDFIVYPNPTTNRINFEVSNENGVEVILYNLLGAKLERLSLMAGITYSQLDVSGYAKGTYVLVVRSSEKIKTRRVVIR